jgi:hypothetical protein
MLRTFADDFPAYPYTQLSFLHEWNAYMYAWLGDKDAALLEIEALADIFAKWEAYEPFKYIIHRDNRDKIDEEALDFVKNALAKWKPN